MNASSLWTGSHFLLTWSSFKHWKYDNNEGKELSNIELTTDVSIVNTVQCRYNVVNFFTNIHKRHLTAGPLGWSMGCLLPIQYVIDSLSQLLWFFYIISYSI